MYMRIYVTNIRNLRKPGVPSTNLYARSVFYANTSRISKIYGAVHSCIFHSVYIKIIIPAYIISSI